MFKDFFFFYHGWPSCLLERTILAILVESRLGNIPMKFESHWHKGSGVSF